MTFLHGFQPSGMTVLDIALGDGLLLWSGVMWPMISRFISAFAMVDSAGVKVRRESLNGFDAFDRFFMGDGDSCGQVGVMKRDSESFFGLIDEPAPEPDAGELIAFPVRSGVSGDDAIDHEGHVAVAEDESCHGDC